MGTRESIESREDGLKERVCRYALNPIQRVEIEVHKPVAVCRGGTDTPVENDRLVLADAQAVSLERTDEG